MKLFGKKKKRKDLYYEIRKQKWNRKYNIKEREENSFLENWVRVGYLNK